MNISAHHKTIYVIAGIGQSLMAGPTEFSGSAIPQDKETSYWTSQNSTIEKYFPRSVYDLVHAPDADSALYISPMVYLGRQLAALGKKPIAVVSYSAGGHSIEAFLPSGDRLNSIIQGSDKSETVPELLGKAVRSFSKLGYKVEFLGWVWFQGHANSSNDAATADAGNYQAHLTSMLAHMRDTGEFPFSSASAKVLIGRSPLWDYDGLTSSSGDSRDTMQQTVRTAQETVADGDSNAAWVSSDYPGGEKVEFSDGTHPTAAANKAIGEDWATAWAENFGI